MTKDQISNIEHKLAFGIGSALVAYAQTQPTNNMTAILTGLGGLLIVWSGYKSNQMNAAPPSNPQPHTK